MLGLSAKIAEGRCRGIVRAVWSGITDLLWAKHGWALLHFKSHHF